MTEEPASTNEIRPHARRRTAPRAVRISTAALFGAAAVSLSIVGSSALAGAATAPKPGSGAARQFPGASGSIAAINGMTLEVQSTSSQTAVTYTATTTFEQTVSASASAVTPGSCISAFGKPTSASKKQSKKGATATGPVTATTVTITQPTSGTCATGFGGGAGFRGGAGRPSGGGSQEGGASRAPANRRNFGGGTGQFGAASGSVTSVNGSKVTVSETNPATKKKSSIVVTLTSATTLTERTTATAADLAVGKCATAVGTADTTGAITARSISLSTAGASGCTTAAGGFGGFGGRRGTGGPGAGGAAGV